VIEEEQNNNFVV